jgi:hypothetical protein
VLLSFTLLLLLLLLLPALNQVGNQLLGVAVAVAVATVFPNIVGDEVVKAAGVLLLLSGLFWLLLTLYFFCLRADDGTGVPNKEYMVKTLCCWIDQDGLGVESGIYFSLVVLW